MGQRCAEFLLVKHGGSEPICWSSGIGINNHSVVQWLHCHKNSNSNHVAVASNVCVSCHSGSHHPY